MGFLNVSGEGKNRKYIFKHVIIQEVSYQLMLHQQRSKLHQQVADWYEQHYQRSIDRYVGLLAHHYSHAGPSKAKEAFYYIDRAGDAALQAGAAREAADYYLLALELSEKVGESEKNDTDPGEKQVGKDVFLIRFLRLEIEKTPSPMRVRH